jgi:hypothetical protein
MSETARFEEPAGTKYVKSLCIYGGEKSASPKRAGSATKNVTSHSLFLTPANIAPGLGYSTASSSTPIFFASACARSNAGPRTSPVLVSFIANTGLPKPRATRSFPRWKRSATRGSEDCCAWDTNALPTATANARAPIVRLALNLIPYFCKLVRSCPKEYQVMQPTAISASSPTSSFRAAHQMRRFGSEADIGLRWGARLRLGRVLINLRRCPVRPDTDRLRATAANVAMGQTATLPARRSAVAMH